MISIASIRKQYGLTFRDAIKLIMESPCKSKPISLTSLFLGTPPENDERLHQERTGDQSQGTPKGGGCICK